MSEFPHDDFAKTYLTELLSTIGKAFPNRPLKAETRAADIWFELTATATEQRSQLGLFGDLLTRNALIEVFWNPATPCEIRTSKGKLATLEGELIRQAAKQQHTLTEAELPLLLLLMPTASDAIRDGFGAVSTETAGVYHLPKLERTTLVVLHRLPQTANTLWLRLLARAGEQRRAIAEFTELSPQIPLHANIADILADYRAMLEARATITPEVEELIMNLSAAYLKKQQEWKQEGRLEVARNLLLAGVAIELIAKATGLTIAEVTQLQQQP
jgi:hypothetical protein